MNARRLALSVGVGIFTLLVIAAPTDLIPNPIFGRQIEATVWALPVALLTAVLAGVLIALPRPSSCRPATRTGYVGGTLSYLAIGCPTCNHVVVLALGTTGAMAWFAPVQPYLALIGLAILGGAILHRVWLVREADTTSARV